MPDITLDKRHTAVLIADFYTEIMNTLAHATERGVVAKAAAVQAAARDAGVMVCYCATVFRPGYPEIGQRNKTFGQRKTSGQAAVPDPLDVIHPGVKPREGEVVVGKHRINALYGTGLDVALRANDIRDLLIFGYATSGVILSTVRYGADLDFNLIVVEDCCSDSDSEVHDFLTQRIFPRQAEVVGSEDVIRALGTGYLANLPPDERSDHVRFDYRRDRRRQSRTLYVAYAALAVSIGHVVYAFLRYHVFD